MSLIQQIDPLSHLFAHLQLRAMGQARMLVLSPPWGIAVPAAYREFNMYSVRKGRCVLQINGEAPRELGPGDAALVLRNRPHSLHDGTATRLRPLEWWHARPRDAASPHDNESDDQAWLICENFRLSGMLGCSFAAALGDCVILKSSESDGSRHQHLFSMLCHETTYPRPGAAFVYARLMELFFVEFLRECVMNNQADDQPNILRVLFDPQLLRAVQQMQENPSAPWTVASLARAAGMSRTAFAVRFTRLAGLSPLNYVTRWRMAIAEKLLSSGHTLAETAGQIGYESEASFSRAFKRETGLSPGTIRKNTTQLPAAFTT